MKKAITIILLFICHFCYSQDEQRPHKIFEENLEEENGKIISAWLPNGEKIIENGNGYREYEVWSRIRRYYYRNGDANGKVIFWDTTRNSILTLGNSKNGELEGDWSEFYENGKLKLQVIYKEGKRHGEEREYFKNGNIKATRIYENGDENGISMEYNSNGQLIKKYTLKALKDCKTCNELPIDSSYLNKLVRPAFQNGLYVDEFLEYHDNGELKERRMYKNNCQLFTEHEELGGGILEIKEWRLSCPYGKWEYFDENGKLIKEEFYEDCKKIN